MPFQWAPEPDPDRDPDHDAAGAPDAPATSDAAMIFTGEDKASEKALVEES